MQSTAKQSNQPLNKSAGPNPTDTQTDEFRQIFPSVDKRIQAWSQVYTSEGRRWGMTPSLAAHLSLTDINSLSVPNGALLDVGCGYGRDLALFRTFFPDMALHGVEPSQPAIALGSPVFQEIKLRNLYENDVFRNCWHVRRRERFDIIFANYFVHLFSDEESAEVFRILRAILKPHGALILSFVSTRDPHFGLGKHLGRGAYEVRQGMPWRFVNEQDVRSLAAASGLSIQILRPYTETELVADACDRVESLYVVANRDD